MRVSTGQTSCSKITRRHRFLVDALSGQPAWEVKGGDSFKMEINIRFLTG